MSQTITLVFATNDVHNLNRRYHWRKEAAIVKAARRVAADAAVNFLTPMMAAVLTVDIGYPDKRKRDRSNYVKHIKACVDGFVADAGILPGDDDALLIDGGTRSHIHGKTGLFTFTFHLSPTHQEITK